jgi:S-(hydroxymethyl)glutathione dehydrogenase/alcohol dehydrogenase
MKAAVIFAPETPFEVTELTVDKPAPREVLVRVGASGLCHSDYHFANGDLPFAMPAVLGHEAAGIVEQVGSEVTTVAVGDHVVACASSFCGQCDKCVSGRNHLCSSKPKRSLYAAPRLSLPNGERVHQGSVIGGFAEQLLVHENAIVKIPRELPLDRAALLGCGVVTGLGVVFNAARVTPNSCVVVLGCGGVGLNVVQGAKLAGARQIIAVDPMPQKRELARKMGATDVVVGGSNAVEEVRALSNGGADFSFEVIGLPHTMEQAVLMLAPGGLMTIVGAMAVNAKISLPGIAMLLNEWRVQGSYMGSSPFTRDIPRYASLCLCGKLDLDSLIAERIELKDVNKGFATMLGATQARSVIVFPEVMAEASAKA